MSPKQLQHVYKLIRPQDRRYVIMYSLLWIAAGAAVIWLNIWVALAIAAVSSALLYVLRHKSVSDPELPTRIAVSWAIIVATGLISYKCYVHPATMAAAFHWQDDTGFQLVKIYGTALFAVLVPVFWHLAYNEIQFKLASKKIKGRKAHDIFS